jgi:hypothetical protein
MEVEMRTQVDEAFLSLSIDEQEAIISHGVALRLSDLRQRLFLAESKLRQYEEKYGTTLARLEASGLPDDAGYEMHEDYIMWRHWAGVANQAQQGISALERIAWRGLYSGEAVYAG